MQCWKFLYSQIFGMWRRIDRKSTAFGETTVYTDNVKMRIEIHKITERLNGCYNS